MGLGLIGIGRPWPSGSDHVATQAQVDDLLETALRFGIGFFDTAPAYGLSEERLGRFLGTVGDDQRGQFVVATKVGEHWSPESGGRTAHDRESMLTSVRRSARLLGRIDLLQIHKATSDVIESDKVRDTLLTLQRDFGIACLGASVSTPDAADAALRSGYLTHVQLSVNAHSPANAAWSANHARSITVVANRPYASGRLAGTAEDREAALRYSIDHVPHGILLTGTVRAAHLQDSVRALNRVTHGG